MREEVLGLIRKAVADLNEELQYPELEEITEETALLGGGAGIDSLSLVSLIVDLEQRTETKFGQSVVLADEKAMSMQNSPYRTVGSLADFVIDRLETGL